MVKIHSSPTITITPPPISDEIRRMTMMVAADLLIQNQTRKDEPMTDVNEFAILDETIEHLAEKVCEMVHTSTTHEAAHNGLGDQALALLALMFKREMDRHAAEMAAEAENDANTDLND